MLHNIWNHIQNRKLLYPRLFLKKFNISNSNRIASYLKPIHPYVAPIKRRPNPKTKYPENKSSEYEKREKHVRAEPPYPAGSRRVVGKKTRRLCLFRRKNTRTFCVHVYFRHSENWPRRTVRKFAGLRASPLSRICRHLRLRSRLLLFCGIK